MNLSMGPSPPPRPRGPQAAWQGGGEQQPPLHLPHLSPGDEDAGHHFFQIEPKKLSPLQPAWPGRVLDCLVPSPRCCIRCPETPTISSEMVNSAWLWHSSGFPQETLSILLAMVKRVWWQ